MELHHEISNVYDLTSHISEIRSFDFISRLKNLPLFAFT